ncbi:alpha/beta hydrolase fold domain-containing protein [Nonomuraea rubra]|uniref:alpha/beta hydrolase fold domain-containing protein n=1 Tax=Nonomuraea rubra TaxID=46180 RepID=UPI003CD052FD
MPSTPVEALLEGRAVERREVTVPAPDGAGIPMTVLAPAGARSRCAVRVLDARRRPDHGGPGSRSSTSPSNGSTCSAPSWSPSTTGSRPRPAAPPPVEDCYRGLQWIAGHAGDLGIDPGRVVVAGASAGGGLAAGRHAHGPRPRGTPPIAAQVLICPMLDHRNTTTSSRQYAGEPGVWTRESNEFAWNAVLGGLDGDRVPAYVSPATAEDLSGLPRHLHRRRVRRGLPRRGRGLRHPHLGRGRAGRAARLGGRLPRLRRPLPAGRVVGRRPRDPYRMAHPHPGRRMKTASKSRHRRPSAPGSGARHDRGRQAHPEQAGAQGDPLGAQRGGADLGDAQAGEHRD